MPANAAWTSDLSRPAGRASGTPYKGADGPVCVCVCVCRLLSLIKVESSSKWKVVPTPV